MKKIYLFILMFVTFICFKNDVLAIDEFQQKYVSGHSMNAVVCGPYYEKNEDVKGKKADYYNAGSADNVLFLLIDDPNNTWAEVQIFLSESGGNGGSTGTSISGVINNGDNGNKMGKACPKFLGDTETKGSANGNDGNLFKYADDKSKLGSDVKHIFTLIHESGKSVEEENFNTCTYKVAKKPDGNLSSNDDKASDGCYEFTGDTSDVDFVVYNNGDDFLVMYNNSEYVNNGGGAIAKVWSAIPEVKNEKKCPPIYYYTDGSTKHGFYYDEMDASGSVDSTAAKKICAVGENGDSSIDVCGYYDKYFGMIQDLYGEVKNNCNNASDDFNQCAGKYVSEADEYKEDLERRCDAVYRLYNAKDSCVKKCLGFADEYKEVKEGAGLKDYGACNLSNRLIKWFANILKWGKYFVPVLAIILGIIDFIKAIASQSDDEMKKAQGRFVRRLITAALMFLVPFIIEFILETFNIGDVNNPYCNLL